MTTTFKFFQPNGDCRRVTFTAIPELAAINELIDGMVEETAERRQLTYVDSEGDQVVIKTSRDVVEAVNDARETGAKTIKVFIRPRGCGGKSQSRCAGGTRPQESQSQSRCAGGAKTHESSRGCGRGRRGLFAHHPFEFSSKFSFNEFSNEFNEFANVFGAIFPGVFVEVETTKERGASGASEARATSAEVREATKDAAASPSATPSPAAEVDPQAPTHESEPRPEEAKDAASSTNATEAQGASTSNTWGEDGSEEDEFEDELGAKAALLRDMGFELPLDVARNMIKEMGGRMDLIVRALVANAK